MYIKFTKCSFYTDASRQASTNVGFIGLGNMGGHMAKNLMSKVIQFF